MKKLASILFSLAAIISCDKEFAHDGDFLPDAGYKADSEMAIPGHPSGGGGQQGGGQAGVVTAGEWNDLDNWPFWGHLMTTEKDEQTEYGFAEASGYWRFWTDRRVAVTVKNASGDPQPGIKVELSSGTDKVWTSVTDVQGRADCWIGLYDVKYQAGTLSITVGGTQIPEPPAVTSWTDEEVAMNEYQLNTLDVPVVEPTADILFIVDATGSMTDEIDFLKADLLNILQRGQQLETPVKIRTGALFYRDVGDDYITKTSEFTTDFDKTMNFVNKQYAAGGGDFPEAVHTALEVSLQEFNWNSKARARLAFMLLDAPPHQDHEGVIESLQKSIEQYASMGIKLIPVASSGIDKPTEFCLRLFSIATGGTYVFLTNDSGVGGDHIQATVGEYEVEKLNDLIVRLIQKYLS